MTHLPTANPQDVCDLCQQLDGLFDKVDEGIPMKEYLEDDSKMEEPQQTQVASGMDVACAITKLGQHFDTLDRSLNSMDQRLDCMIQHEESLNQFLNSVKQDRVSMKRDLISMKQDRIFMSDALKLLAAVISEKHHQSLSLLDDEK